MAKRITILGSTGSVGENTLDLIRHAKPGEFTVTCLTAHTNAVKLAKQALEFKPQNIVLSDESQKDYLRDALAGTGIEIGFGRMALIEAGRLEADFVMAAIVGAAGLQPTLAAVQQGCYIGLANKECLVCAGVLFMQCAQQYGATILPVDSEHNAIFQVLNAERPDEVRKLILTASGGPFRQFSKQQLENASPKQALAHPVWAMGDKISIDSASLMNKGLELIEASYLFDTPQEQIDIIIHPQSIIHSMVEYVDGSVLAQLGSPDMRTPIAYALAWPARMETSVKPLDLAAIARLDFELPDTEKFPALGLARNALITGGAAPTVLNASNEIAVAAFLAGRIKFTGITDCCDNVLNVFENEPGFAKPLEAIEQVLDIDGRARETASAIIAKQGLG